MAAVVVLVVAVTSLEADPRSQELRARASDALYNLEADRAVTLFREAVAVDPSDAAAHRGLASALWMTVTFRRGTLAVDYYLGRISRDNVKLPPPPPAIETEFQTAVQKAIALTQKRLASDPNDLEAQYEFGSAIGLRASYGASVRGSVRASFSAARQAFDAHERVLTLDPKRHDAGLVVGTYRYVVASLPAPMRVVAYMAGFGGGRERGLQLVEGAAAFRGENQTDARLALVILYNRERRYADALKPLAVLREQYPRNRLLWFETGSTYLRAGNASNAERFLSEGMKRLAGDARPRMFGEEALWHYKRGVANAMLGRSADAERDLRRVLALGGREWVQGRAHLELGKLALNRGDRTAATRELQLAAALCDKDKDAFGAAEARRLAP
jgi:tetratricopeptide (TPR) repeat protein